MKTASFIAYLTLAIGCLVSDSSAGSLRTVALTGVPTPGTGINFAGLGSAWAVLNDAGQTAFFGSSTELGRSIWSDGGGAGLTPVAGLGNTAPGTGGAAFLSFNDGYSPVLNGAGQTALSGYLTGAEVTSSNHHGIWSDGGGAGLTLVARTGNAAPGTNMGVNFSFLGGPVLNGAGQTAFHGVLTGTGIDSSNDRGIWLDGGGDGLTLVAREGNAAPDTSSGVNFASLIRPSVLNDAGEIAFYGGLTGTGIDSSNNAGIWSGGGNGLTLVARRGDAAPGTISDVRFSAFFSSPALNNAGQTAFGGLLTGTDVVESNNLGIWSEGGGNGLTLVAREGNAAPDTGSAVFGGVFSSPVINDAGQTAFVGRLTGSEVDRTNDSGIWSEGGDDGLTLVAREGNAAPGTGGAFFRDFDKSSRLPVLNGAGQTAFIAHLTGPGVTVSNDLGIWAEDRSGVLKLIARQGDLLDVDDGPGTDLRTILSLHPAANTGSFVGNTGNGDGRPSGFNNLGQLVFSARFTDGSSGVFVSSRVAVPEPSALVLAAFIAMTLTMRRCC